MKLKYLRFILAMTLCTACAATETGPDEAQKTKLAGHAEAWRSALNTKSFEDDFIGLYAKEVDFNGKPATNRSLAATMQKFLGEDYRFDLKILPDAWVLDSMKGSVYAGHFTGVAHYDLLEDDSFTVSLWLRLPEEGSPEIVGQFDDIGQVYNTMKARYRDYVMKGQDFDEQGRPNYYYWDEMLKTVAPTVGELKYFCKYDGRALFYASAKENLELVGIVDETGAVILPFEFSEIGSIGVMHPGGVEVKKGTKKGILRLDGSTVLPVEFDAILPVFDDPRRAFWAYRDGSWANYDDTGLAVIPEGGSGDGNGPDWVTYLKQLPLEERWNPSSKTCVAARLGGVYHGDGDGMPYIGEFGIVKVPFTLQERNIAQNMQLGSMEFDESYSMTIDSVFLSETGQVQMIKTMEHWGVGGRESFHDLEQQWVVFEPEMRDTAQMVNLYRKNLDHESCIVGEKRFLGDSMLETVQNEYLEVLGYYAMPRFRYYRIHSSGLQPLLSEREFPFMSLVAIDASFLAGCFSGYANENETAAFKQGSDLEMEDYYEIIRTAKHFRMSDLDYLVNEVYAAHGLRFKKPVFQEYFGEKSWYKPISDNVDADLTAIERANIAFVRKVQADMKIKEEAYTQATFEVDEGI